MYTPNFWKIIVAMDAERGIGRDGTIPWHFPEDLHYFRTTTEHQIVVMGRQTWEGLPDEFKPLPKRTNIVLSHHLPSIEGEMSVVHSFKQLIDLIAHIRKGRTVFIIGGESIYQQALVKLPISEIIISCISGGIYGCDQFFPHLSTSEWRCRPEKTHLSWAVSVLRYEKKTNRFTEF